MSPNNWSKRTLDVLPVRALDGQRALVRVDFNVPIRDGSVGDDTRIRAALPTIRWLREKGCRVVLLSHLGRPGGTVVSGLSLQPVVEILERELGIPVTFVPDAVSQEAVRTTRRLRRGEVALVENTRFVAGEESNDASVAESFSALGDFFVNDAFGSAHRAHASTAGVAHRLSPAVAGFLMAKELKYLGSALSSPRRPFVAILGGAKISGKMDVIEALLPKVDTVIIGGAMACTFFVALGYEVGRSLVEQDRVSLAKELLRRADKRILLPEGATIAQKLESGCETRDVPSNAIPPEWAMYDISRAAAKDFAETVSAAETVVWNGPMGVFETPPFDAGTRAVAGALVEATARGATTVVGGGDSAAAITGFGLEGGVTHVSTGGGASLEFLEGKPLPGVTALDDA